MRSGQGHQRKNASFAVIVGAHYEQAVFDRYGDDQCPEYQGQRTERRLGSKLIPYDADNGLKRIEWTCSKIAVDDAEGKKRR